MVRVLDTGTKVRGFKPDRGNTYLRLIKLHSTSSFGEEAQSEGPYRKILWHIKELFEYERTIS
jgi:hypothetical protein